VTESVLEEIVAATGNKNHPVPLDADEIRALVRARL